jgi:hypothetical protein
MRLGDDGTSLEIKALEPARREVLLEAAPEVFFLPPGFKGAGLFARLAALDAATLTSIVGPARR